MRELKDMTEPELGDLFRYVARRVEGAFADCRVAKPQFALLVWNDPQIAQYVSNCERSSMIQALRETADRLEQNQDVTRE